MNKQENKPEHWQEAFFPEVLAKYIAAFPRSDNPIFHRARRFREYWKNNPNQEDVIKRAWGSIAKAAKSDDDLLSLFIVMPDNPVLYPFDAIYGKRIDNPDAEMDRYKGYLANVKELEILLNPHRPHFLQMLQDATATPDAHVACFKFRELDSQLLQGLRSLKTLLELIDPAAKIPTKQWKSPDAALRNYVILVASLNRYLKPESPKHSTLAFLATVNCPSAPVTKDQLRKAWGRNADKNY